MLDFSGQQESREVTCAGQWLLLYRVLPGLTFSSRWRSTMTAPFSQKQLFSCDKCWLVNPSCSCLINSELDADRDSLLIKVILTSNLHQLLLREIAAMTAFCSDGLETSAGAGRLTVQSILLPTSFDFLLGFFPLHLFCFHDNMLVPDPKQLHEINTTCFRWKFWDCFQSRKHYIRQHQIPSLI